MPDYERLYFHLFAAITDAVEEIESANYGFAKEVLIQAQQTAEERYIEEE